MERSLDDVTVEVMDYAGRTLQSVEPGGGYVGVWCRDASFILRGMAQLGKTNLCLASLNKMWANAIQPESDARFGRGSPLTHFSAKQADRETLVKWSGALPTTIEPNRLEIYGVEPDVDSNALAISTTCDILMHRGDQSTLQKLLPPISKAVSYLLQRAEPGSMLVKQNPNEDWMDTMMRSGIVPYTQGVWAQALASYAEMLNAVGRRNEADRTTDVLKKVVEASNRLLREELEYCRKGNPTCQDLTFLLLVDGIEPNTAAEVLDLIKQRTRRTLGPAVIDPPTGETRPARTGRGVYQNGAFWPWVTSREILARLKLDLVEDAVSLTKTCIPYFAVEWIEPTGGRKKGRFPFRTGIAGFIESMVAVRSAIGKHVARRQGFEA